MAAWTTQQNYHNRSLRFGVEVSDYELHDMGAKVIEYALQRVAERIADVVLDELGDEGIQDIITKLEDTDAGAVMSLVAALKALETRTRLGIPTIAHPNPYYRNRW